MIGLWREGDRRLHELDPADRPGGAVVAASSIELRRRLGGPFTADELAELYCEQGTDWCFDIAIAVAPGTPEAWDMRHRRPARRSCATCASLPTTPDGAAPGGPRTERRPVGAHPARSAPRRPRRRLSVAGAADDDLVLLDRHLDRPVAGPVLGVHGVVLDGGVEPQAVALLAVIERGLQRRAGACAPRPPRPPRRPRRRRAGFVLVVVRPRSSASRRPPRPPRPRRPRARRRSARRPRRGDRSRRRSRRPAAAPSGSSPGSRLCSRLKV